MLKVVHDDFPGKKVLVAGLSNGGHGALAFSSRFENDISGIILVSGGVPQYHQGKVPALIIWGRQDERIPVALGRQVYERSRKLDQLVELEGDHFVFLRKHGEIGGKIRAWLAGLRP